MRPLILFAVTWFLLMAGTGAWVPFFALHLQRTGVDPAAVGLLLAVLPVSRIVATPLWTWVGDRTGKGLRVLQAGAFVSTAGAALTLGDPSLPVLALALAVYAGARAPLGPLMDAMAVTLLERRYGRADGYGRLRLWGSLGFLGGGFVAGLFADGDPEFPVRLALVLWLVGALGTLAFPADVKARPAPVGPAMRALFGRPWCPPLLAACVLHGVGLTSYDSLYALLVGERGLSSVWTSAALLVGVGVELGVLAAGPWILRRFGAERLVVVSVVVAAGRWLATALVTDPWALTALQALHGVSFAAFWAAGVEWFRREAPGEIRASAQALFTTATYGVGALGSGLLTSWLLPRFGMTGGFLTAAVLALAGAVLAEAARRRAHAPATAPAASA